jgi:hypothetical protein
MSERKYLPTFAELIDRLSILQLKEVFIPENREEYAKEIKDIMYDIEIILSDCRSGTNHQDVFPLDAKTIRNIIVLAQSNTHIWYNESAARKGDKDGNRLLLTHSINGIRNTAKNRLQELVGGRKDLKVDCCAAEFCQYEPSWKDDV